MGLGRRGVVLVPWVVAFVVTGPLLFTRGFWLFGDMVFVPRQPWKPEWYGGDGGVPRAVPSDALASLATQVVPGDLVQKAVLVAIFGFAGWGVLRLLAGVHPVAAVVASVFYQWNPFVFERLAIGHWALLCGYAALPWVVAGALRFARDGKVGWPGLFIASSVAAWTSPSGGVIAALCAMAVLLADPGGRRIQRFLVAAVTVLAVNLPWLIPGILATSGAPVDTTGASAFAARSDTPLGDLASVLTLGAMWKSSVVPTERDSMILVLLALVVVLAGLAGLVVGRHRERSVVHGLALAAVPLLVFVVATTTGWGQALSGWVATSLPGGGLVRDSQKFLAPFALLVAVGLGHAADRVARAARHASGAVAFVAVVGVIQLMTLPSLAWGNLGRWEAATYPAEWASVAELVADETTHGTPTTVALPFEVYRRFSWNDQWAWLDPAPRILPGRVIVDDTLGVGGGEEVAGESSAALRVRQSDQSWDALAPVLEELQVSYVLVEHGTPGDLPTGEFREIGYRSLHEGEHLSLYATGHAVSERDLPHWAPWLLVLDGVLVLVWVAAGAWSTVRRVTRRA
jgi:hypothetical protein